MSSPEPEGVKTPLATLPVASTALLEEPVLMAPGGFLELSWVYPTGVGPMVGGFRFEKVRAHRHRAESHCTAWHSQGAYDTLVEVEPSRWVTELRTAQAPPRHPWQMRHFLLYVDSSGAFEVVAAEWQALTPAPAPR